MISTRKLGSINVSALSIGTGRLASMGAGYTRQAARELLHAAREQGVNLIDTADSYASAQCEKLIGSLLKDHRGFFHISTKVGYPYVELPAPFDILNQPSKKILQKLGVPQNFHAEYVAKCIDASLRRLDVEKIDIFFLHNPPQPVWKNEELVNVLQDAKLQGKIGLAGISSDSIQLIEEACDHPIFSVFQTRINPFVSPPDHLARVLESRGEMCVMANHVLAGGRLASQRENMNHLTKIADELKILPHSLYIAYASSIKGVSTVVSGTGSARHLKENVKAAEINLDANQLRKISEIISKKEKI